jgi:DNA-binding SARP family transcriptional activator/Tfp pilus assembly protein PilF
MLVLELFGTLSLRDDTARVPLAAQQKRPLGLLAILALGGKQGMSRHRIEAYLWPESNAARARHALDQAVYAIRHNLGSDVILSTGQELRLNQEFVSPDIWKFDDAVASKQWAEAVEIYKGMLLDGFHFGESRELETLIDAERGRVLLEYQTAIERLADGSSKAGDHSQDVTWRRKLANSDPLSAAAAKKLILALAAGGDRAAAVKKAREYQELVRQDLGMEPDSEIESLISSLLRSPAAPAIATASSRTTEIANPIASRPTRNHGSRIVGLGSIAVIAVLVIGALTVNNRTASHTSGVAEAAALNQARIPLPTARDAYLLGLKAWEDRTKEGHDRAVVYFRRATELDPGYADAYAGLAEAYVRIGYFGYRPADAMFPKAKAAALRSIELDSTLSTARTALATELIWEHDFAGAESEYQKAITLDPTNATAHQWHGVLLMILRKIPESVAEESRAAELEPLSLQIQNNYATFLNASGEHLAALRHFQKTVGEEPDSAWVGRNPWVLSNMARVYADNGKYADALRMVNRALAIVPGNPRAFHTLTEIYVDMRRSDLVEGAFARADTANEQYPAYRGMVYADLGKADSAFIWFDRQVKWGIQPMLTLQSSRQHDPMRNDPRYKALLRRLGIPVQSSSN